MKHIQFLLVLAILTTASCSGPQGADYYVSLAGNDSWSGTLAAPNDDGTDGPFATLHRAQGAVRELVAASRTSGDPIRVYVRGGTYPVSETLHLTAEDAGTAEVPVIWSGFPDEEAILSGNHTVTGLSPSGDSPGADRIPTDRHDKILVADLRAQGITDFGSFSDREGPGLEVFADGRRLQRARYPNSGFLKIGPVPQTGDSLIHKGSFQWQREGIAVGRHFGRFQVDDNRMASWASSPDIWMHGYYVWDWRDGFQQVASIDAAAGMVRAAPPYHGYGFSKDQRFYFFNVLEELDEPGEWVLDFDRGLLYLWPPDELNEAAVTVSVFDKPAILLEETSHVRIERFVFTEFRKGAIEIVGGTDNRVLGNVVRNVGRTPIVVRDGTSHEVRSNDLTDLGGGGIDVTGGDRMTLESGNHRIVNNKIERFGRVQKTGIPGIRLVGVGNTAAHNELADSPDNGIVFGGNDLTIEYNELHRLARESDDVGAIYAGRDYSMRGNVIRYNYLHHLEKPMHVGVMGVYLDDFMSGVTVYGNVFLKAGRCVFMGGGRRNIIENNVFVGCSPSIFLDARGKVRNTEYFDGRYTALTDRMAAVNATEPPYSLRYPELVDLYNDDPAMPKYNRLANNVSMDGTWLGLYSGLPIDILDMTGNVIADQVVLQSSAHTAVETEEFDLHGRDDIDVVAAISESANRVLNANPGRFDNILGVFHWEGAGESPLDAIPFEQIGLVADEYRVTVP